MYSSDGHSVPKYVQGLFLMAVAKSWFTVYHARQKNDRPSAEGP